MSRRPHRPGRCGRRGLWLALVPASLRAGQKV